jgi:hypothetical protein
VRICKRDGGRRNLEGVGWQHEQVEWEGLDDFSGRYDRETQRVGTWVGLVVGWRYGESWVGGFDECIS